MRNDKRAPGKVGAVMFRSAEGWQGAAMTPVEPARAPNAVVRSEKPPPLRPLFRSLVQTTTHYPPEIFRWIGERASAAQNVQSPIFSKTYDNLPERTRAGHRR